MQKQITSIGDTTETAWPQNADAWGCTLPLSGYQIIEQLEVKVQCL